MLNDARRVVLRTFIRGGKARSAGIWPQRVGVRRQSINATEGYGAQGSAHICQTKQGIRYHSASTGEDDDNERARSVAAATRDLVVHVLGRLHFARPQHKEVGRLGLSSVVRPL